MIKKVICGSVLAVGAVAQGQVLLSDNFDSENGGVGSLNYASFVNFNVTDGSVDLIGNGSNDLLPGNGLYVDLDGSTNNAGVLASKDSFVLANGIQYELSFRLAGSQRGDSNEVTVALGSLYSEVFTVASSDPFSTVTRTIVGDGSSALLSFSNAGADNRGALLDNVQLSVVPEPATLAAFAVGLVALARKSRRKI